jgi:hypothetical protein
MGTIGLLNLSRDPGYLHAVEDSRAYVESQGANPPSTASIEQLRRVASFQKEFNEEVKSLSVSVSLSNLNLHKSPDSTLRVEVFGRLPEDLELKLSGGELTLSELYDPGSVRNFFNFGPFHIGAGGPSVGFNWHSENYMGEIHLYLPEKAYERIEISSGIGQTMGDADLNLRSLELLRIQADVGDSDFKGSLSAESLQITGSVGRLRIAEASAAELRLSLDMGDVRVERLNAEKSAEIGGGVGRLTVEQARLRNADLEVGVGDFEIKGELLGRSTISQGVGRVRLDLLGDPKDYFIRSDGGIGRFELSDKRQRIGSGGSEGFSTGAQDAPNSILIQGGLGDCLIDFSR